MEKILIIFYDILKITSIISLIMFITYGIVREKPKKIKGLVLLITSSILELIFTFTFIFDRFIIKQKIKSIHVYIIFMSVLLVYIGLSFIIYFKNRSYNSIKKVKKKLVYTYRPKDEFIYVVYRYNDLLYLNVSDNSGIKHKLNKMEFSDDALDKVNKLYGVKVKDQITRNGIITIKGNTKDEIYYCYLIDIEERLISNSLRELVTSQILYQELPRFDKYVLLNCLTKVDFSCEYDLL